MKFHLPRKLFVAVMAAVVSTQVFAEENTETWKALGKGHYIYTETAAGAETHLKGDLSTVTYDNGSASRTGYDAVGVFGGINPNDTDRAAANTTILVGDGTTETKVNTIIGAGPRAYAVGASDGTVFIGGNKEITVNANAYVGTIIGATDYSYHHTSSNTTQPNGNFCGMGAQSYYNNGDYFSPKANSENATIKINIKEGSIIGQIRGGANGSSTVVPTEIDAATKHFTAKGKELDYPDTELNKYVSAEVDKYISENPAWALNEKIIISVTGGKIGYQADGTTKHKGNYTEEAIIGAGGSGFSVNNAVEITISGDADILGDIYAGAKNKNKSKFAFINSSKITVEGGSIQGNIYGGGAYGEDSSSIVKSDTQILLSGGDIKTLKDSSTGSTIYAGNVYAAGDHDIVKGSTNVTIANKGTAVEGTIFGGGIESSVERERVLTVDSSYNGDKSYKVADFTDIAVNADVTFETLTGAEEGTAVEIAEGATMTVTGEGSAASVTGGKLVLDGSSFELTGDTLSSDVVLDNHAELNLNGANATNTIWVYGCTLSGAENFEGELIVDGGELNLAGSTCADSVIITNGGSVTGSSLATKALTIDTTNTTAGETVIDTNLTIHKGGELALKGGETLVITGSLTMEEGATISLSDDYEYGDEAIIVESGDMTYEDGVTLRFGNVVLEVQDNVLVVMSLFDQDVADTLSLSNWGIATASRTFVNTVRGQRTNTGCIAGGKGTAWAAVLGGNHDINGSDINLKGAAVGADMKVGSAGSVGVAFGYIEGDVKPSGLSDVDQEGTYVALYGEHGLKKLSSTSCLSLDWVAAYGNTESDAEGTDWEQDSLQLNTRLNWNRKVTDRLCMSVFGGLEYFTSESDTVDGVKTGSLQNLRGEIGVGARYLAWGTPGTAASYDEKGAMVTESRPGCEKLVLHGEVRYMNDMVRSNPVIRMEGMSGGSDNPGRQGMGIEAGATYRIGERWSASANYGFNTMDDSREHRVNVGAAYTF